MSPTRRTSTPRRLLLIVTIGAAAFSFGCASVEMQNSMPPPPVVTTSSSLTVCNAAMPNCSGASSFSIATVRDIAITVAWQNVPSGTHSQTLEILQPGGGLYQTLESGLVIPDEVTSGSQTVVQNFPVAGTWITKRSLIGTWTVRVSLDGEPMATQTVQLNP